MSKEKEVKVEPEDQEVKEYRVKRLLIAPQSFKMIMETGRKFEVIEGIPKDGEVVGVTVDKANSCICLFIEHKSYEVIKEGDEIPVLKIGIEASE